MWIDRRILIGIAGASILLNVFLGGAVLGRGARRASGAAPSRPRGSWPGRWCRRPMSRRCRRRIASVSVPRWRRIARRSRPLGRPHREARRQIEADIAAPTYDETRIVADFKALRQTNRDTDEAVDAALIDALAQLPPQSRAALVTHAPAPKPGEPPQPQ